MWMTNLGGIFIDSIKFTSRYAAIAQRFKPTVFQPEDQAFDSLSIHLCICLICVCVSSNNIRSNIKLWNGFKLFLNSTSRSLSCPVAIKDFYHKDRTPASNPWLSLTSWSLAQKLCRSAVRLASAIALRSTWGPVCSAMKYERVPRSDAIPTTFPFIN